MGKRLNVYPNGKAEMAEFKDCTDLHLTRTIESVQTRRGDDAKYVVATPYGGTVRLRDIDAGPRKDEAGDSEYVWHRIRVPRGYKTDLASVPRIGRFLVSRAGPHLEACVVHDWLYQAWIVTKETPTRSMKTFADDVLKAAMREANVGRFKTWLIYNACARFGGKDFKRQWRPDEFPPKRDIIHTFGQDEGSCED